MKHILFVLLLIIAIKSSCQVKVLANQSVSADSVTVIYYLGANNLNVLKQYTATANPAHGNVIFDSTGGVYMRDSAGKTVGLSKVLLSNGQLVNDTFPAHNGVFLLTNDSSIYTTVYQNSLKQKTISLTTTGSTGAATFNTSTAVLNIPNYTITTLAASQFPALTGDVTTTAGSLATTIGANKVTYAKMQTMTANKLLGSGASGTAVAEMTLGTGLSFTSNTLNVTGFLPLAGGTMAGTITMNGNSINAVAVGSNFYYSYSQSTTTTPTWSTFNYFTGSSPQTWTLPAISGNSGLTLTVKNEGSATLTVQRAGSDQLYTSSAVTSVTIAAGASYTFQNNSSYWDVR